MGLTVFCIGAPREDKCAKKSSKGMVECATAARPEGTRAPVINALPLRAPRGHPSAKIYTFREKCPLCPLLPPPPRLLYEMKRSFALTEAGAVGRRPGRAFEYLLAEDLDGRAITRNLQKRGLALPDRCTEVLYHTAVLAGDRFGRWGVSRTFGALLALSCQLRGVRARRPRSQGDMQQSRMHPSHRPSLGRIPDHWGDLPDHWRLRPV